MLLNTYNKIVALFKKNHGYMSFEDLKEARITITQIHEMEKRGAIEKFARGWYWCTVCGIEKPKDYKYVELGKINSDAVICLDSAAYLLGLIEKEPENIAISTERTDRKKMEINFDIRRMYLQRAELPGEIVSIRTKYGTYKVYNKERTICDCARMADKLPQGVLVEVLDTYKAQGNVQYDRIMEYASRLRARKNVEELGLK